MQRLARLILVFLFASFFVLPPRGAKARTQHQGPSGGAANDGALCDGEEDRSTVRCTRLRNHIRRELR
jgi:hypothetical protein